MLNDKLVGMLTDKEAIREAIYKYCRSVDRLDVPLGHSVFHENSRAVYPGGFYDGPGRGVIDKIVAAHARFTAHTHQVSNILIELDGDRAGSEAYATATLRLERQGRMAQISLYVRYIDRWEKRDGRWAIIHREVAYDIEDQREVSSTRSRQLSIPDAPKNVARDKTDSSYKVIGRI